MACATQVEPVGTRSADAPLLAALGGHGVRTDAMTGIQALERVAPTNRVQPGRAERRAVAYKRHGTLARMMHFAVVTGPGCPPALGPTRTEGDVVAHSA